MNNPSTVEKHTALVARLIKDPAVIHMQMTNTKLALLHSGIGAVGEFLEMASSAPGDHFIEEAGDTLFYTRDLMTLLDIPDYKVFIYDADHIYGNTPESPGQAAAYILHYSAELLDAIKKHTIYGQDLDRERVILCLQAMVLMVEIRLVTSNELSPNDVRAGMLQTHVEAVLEANIAKLNLRYPEGYSDEAAAARADKP